MKRAFWICAAAFLLIGCSTSPPPTRLVTELATVVETVEVTHETTREVTREITREVLVRQVVEVTQEVTREVTPPPDWPPTYTPYPTHTPYPSLTPFAVVITPTLPPDFVPFLALSGQGERVSDWITFPPGQYRISYVCETEDENALTVEAIYRRDEGEPSNLEIFQQPYGIREGEVLQQLEGGAYTLQVSGACDWSLDFEVREAPVDSGESGEPTACAECE